MDVVIQVLPKSKKKIVDNLNNKKKFKKKLLEDPDNLRNLNGKLSGMALNILQEISKQGLK